MSIKRPIKPRIPNNVSLPLSLEESARQQQVQQPPTQQPPVQPPVQQPPLQQPPVQQVQQPPAQEPQPPVQEQVEQEEDVHHGDGEEFLDIKEGKTYDETYLNVVTEKNGELEMDLVSHRQKGVEKRYLNVKVTGLRVGQGQGKNEVASCLMNITSKEQFEDLKEFFFNLSWED